MDYSKQDEQENLKTEEQSEYENTSDSHTQVDLEAKCKELEHKYMLALADYQNLVRQSAKERRDAILYANEALILELLPIYDNLKLSVKHIDNDNNNSWLSGIQHVLQQFKKALSEAGVTEIETVGKEFDPIMMEAVEKRETEEKKESGLVAEEVKSGYTLHDKVITPARVVVFG